MATTLSARPNRALLSRDPAGPVRSRQPSAAQIVKITAMMNRNDRWQWGAAVSAPFRRTLPPVLLAGSRADDSLPSEMSLENALKLLGVPEGASFDDILRAKKSIIAGCKGDEEIIAQVEAAYDMLLMQSLSQRRAGKVVDSNIRYADVKAVNARAMGSMPQWLQATIKRSQVSFETPDTGDLGIQAGVYGALMVLNYVNGASTSSAAPYAGADVPGLILATSFGASLYFMTKKNIKLGKATVITIGGLVIGAAVGSVVENWLQVDIVPFFGIHSPAVIPPGGLLSLWEESQATPHDLLDLHSISQVYPPPYCLLSTCVRELPISSSMARHSLARLLDRAVGEEPSLID